MIKTLMTIVLGFCSIQGRCEEAQPVVLNFETEEEMLAATDDKMTDLNTILDWFISWNHSKLKEHEKSYKSLNDWETQLAKLDKLKKQISLTNQLFLDFRNQCAETVALSFEGKSEKKEMHALTQFSLTTWYIDFLQSSLFPENWKELSQKSVTPANPKTPLD